MRVWPLMADRDLPSAMWPLAAAIQSRFSVSCEASDGWSRSAISRGASSTSYPVEIFCQLCGFLRLLSSQDFHSSALLLVVAIQSRFSVNRVASSSCYPIEIYSQQCSLKWLLSSRESSVSSVDPSSCCPVENLLSAVGLWSLLLGPVYPRSSDNPIYKR